MLCEILEKSNIPGMTDFKVWNPKTNHADRQHIMPVITPAFPAMNSTHNVTGTTKRILLDEFRRGYEVVRNVEAQKGEWCEVHEPVPFFKTFKHFLWVEILALSDETYKKYCGWVESKLRILTMQLEAITGMVIHPNPVQYDLRGSDPDWPHGCGMFIAFMFSKAEGAFPGQTVDLRSAFSQFLDVIGQWVDKDTYAGQYHLRIRRVNTAQLPKYAVDPEGADAESRKRQSQDRAGGDSKRRRVTNGK